LCRRCSVRTRGREFEVEEGFYVYVGSCGRSCSSRLSRHFSKEKKPFWHVDFATLQCCEAVGAVALRAAERDVAKALSARFSYVAGFGSSDDEECPSHLFKAELGEALDALTELLARAGPPARASSP